jgi:predicted HicB family RNase H-like nuclease
MNDRKTVKPKDRRMTIRIAPEQHRLLKHRAVELGTPMNTIVIHLLTKYLEEK